MTTTTSGSSSKIASTSTSDSDREKPKIDTACSANGPGQLKRTKSLNEFFGKDGDVDISSDEIHIMDGAVAAAAADPSADANDDGNSNGNKKETSNMPRTYSTEWCNTRVVMLDDGGGENDTKDCDEACNTAASIAATAEEKTDDNDIGPSDSIEMPPKPLSESKWMRRDSIPPNGPSATPPSIDELKSWQFDVLSYQHEALISTFASVLEYYDIPAKYSIDVQTLHNFSAYAMERHNKEAAYHNWHHGVSCMHMSFLLLSLGGADAYLTDDHIFALLFAALVHDVDHAGHNNDFEVKTATDRAAKYGNDAVLENHSITITYEEILTRDGCDIFGGMKAEGREEEWKVLLDMAKEYVLWTDPARHGELLKTLATKREEASAPTSMWNRDDPDSRSLLCRMIIHAADISNPVHSNFAVVRDWCSRISTEFAEQAKKESEAGLPVTPFMDGLDDEYRVSKQQIGFYQWMAIPFFTMVAKCLPDAAEVESHCSRNKKRYEDIVARIDDVRKNGEVLEDDEEKNEDSKEG